MKRETVLVVLLLLLAFGLRVWGLADHNIWWDEGVGAWAARLPVRAILDWTAQDVHPPLYYLLLRGWWLLVGDGEFVLRFPSALGSTLGVAAIYGLGVALGGRRAGALAALFLTLSRFAVAWSQEIRMYAWATTLATVALWAAVRLWQTGSCRAWVAYVTAVAGSLLTIYLTVSVPLVANLAFPLAWLWKGRPRRLLVGWITAQLVAALLFIPWAAYTLPRMHSWSTEEPVSPTLFVHLYATMLAVGIPVNLATHTLLTLITFGVLAAGLVALWRMFRSPEQTAGLMMLLLGLALPAVVVYAVSIPGNPFYARPLVPRYLLPLSACFYTVLGWGLARLTRIRRWAAGVGVALAACVALSGLARFYPGRARQDDYVSLAATLQAHLHPGDKVVLHTDRGWPVFAAHYPGDWHGVPYGARTDTWAAEGLLNPLWNESEGIWLVTTPDAQRTDPQQAVQTWLEDRAVISTTWSFGENALSLYARTSERAGDLHNLGPDFVPPGGVQAEMGPGAALLGTWVPLPRYLTGDTVHLSLYWALPPQEDVTVEMVGPAQREMAFASPRPADSGPTHQLIDLPLTPDLPGGRYRLVLHVGAEQAVQVGRFTLVQRELIGAATYASISHPLERRLGESILLLGYDLPQTTVEPGGVLELTLYWQATEPLSARYKVFTHLLGQVYNAANGNLLWGQQDNEPVNDQAPTTLWTPGVVVTDPYHIPVGPDAPPGPYALEVGMYGLVDGTRLPVFGPDGEPLGDSVILDPIEVQAP